MKNHSLLFIYLLSSIISQVAFAQKGYSIKGEITGVEKENTYAYLSPMRKAKNHVLDSVKITNGKFTFTGKVKEPNLYTISIQRTNGAALLVIENAAITIKGKATEMWNASISGSALTDEMIAYQVKYANPAREELIANTKLSQEHQAKGDSLKAAEYMKLNADIMQKQYVIAEQYIRKHPNSFQSLSLLEWGWKKFDKEKTKHYLQSFPTHLQNHSITQRIAAEVEAEIKIEEIVKIGMPALAFSQPDTTNTLVSLHSFRGKYVLIDFWASWCGPCRVENPNLVKAYEKYHPNGFEILGVSLDDDKAKWQKAILKDKLTWTHVSDLKGWDNEAAILYGIKSIPGNFLIDPQGKIVAKGLRGEDLERKLQEVFKTP